MVAQNLSPSIFSDYVSGISLEKLAELYSTTSLEIIKWFQQPPIQQLYRQFRRFQRAQQLITERQARLEAIKSLAELAAHPAPNAESVRAAASILRATSHLAANRPPNPKPQQNPHHRTPSVPRDSNSANPTDPDSSAASQTPRDPFSRIGQFDNNDLLVEFLPALLQSQMNREQRANQSTGQPPDNPTHQPPGQQTDQPITQSELSEPSAHEAILIQNTS